MTVKYHGGGGGRKEPPPQKETQADKLKRIYESSPGKDRKNK